MKRPEILAPAGNMESLIAALRCGADAVYVGGMSYSARSSAANFDLPNLAKAARLCHIYGAKLYLAVNTLLTDSELDGFLEFVKEAAYCGVDACIVQDLGVLRCIRQVVPDMPLHASTQMSIHTVEGALQAAALGCSRVVAAREMSAADLRQLCRLPLEVEVFVHGALCMSVSGQCSFSALVGGRSANRGRCAQACRLPWRTPKGSNPAALSLKDLSLVQHVRTLEEMGVTSFKIEGRMKRPEYVAASVTALRTALEGETPDLESLRAIFARDGFTDGYFSGKKQNMFGFRRKEEVLAAQKVLQQLQNTYRKPRKTAEIRFLMQLEADQPAKLHAVDSDGHAVTVQGDIPQIAQKSALTAALLEKHLQKLGDTIFYGGTAELENADNLTLSAAQCNAMRRDAILALYSSRAELAQNRYTVTDAVPTLPQSGETEKMARWRLHVRTPAQLKAAQNTEHLLCVPLHLAHSLAPSVSIWLESPRIIADEARYRQQLAALWDKGFRHLLCHNLADVRIGKTLGFQLHGGFGLNCTNQWTARSLMEQGLLDVTGSYELRMSRLSALGRTLPCGAFVYGRLPMMLFRLCPIQAQDGCQKQGCSLKDRTGQQFPLVCSGDYTELCNAQVLWLADKQRNLRFLDFWDFYFTTETPQELETVLWDYAEVPAQTPKNRTNGLYFKGGLA